MTKPLDCTGLPQDALVGKHDFKEFVDHGREIKLTAKEAKLKGWLIEDGEPTVAHTKTTYRSPNDWSKVDYPVVAPVYTELEEKWLRGMLELLDDMKNAPYPVPTRDAIERLEMILGPHNRALSESVTPPESDQFNSN